ncbi:hypothetical protein KVV02_006976 [Mortierella alpina]|uniref:Uncharacterized protein n=1 Tax=Mortierella alpina TaxID=64518 RepID=A0A9P8A9Y7_MORAP|nr:hypothetical protein KVV02_006976 [Mortierella alpina]
MPHPTLASAHPAAPSAAAVTLNDPSPQHSLSSAALPSSCSSSCSSSSPPSLIPLAIKTPGLQHVHDSTLSLPIGSTLTTIPRKSGSSRIGQSIIGQLLAAHTPGRQHHTLSNDVALSHETIRPHEQQRRSILPLNWTVGLSAKASSAAAGLQGLFLAQPAAPPASPLSRGRSAAGGSIVTETKERSEPSQPSSPSVWLESIISGLSRSDLNTPPHYATLPRVQWDDEQLGQHKDRPRHARFLFAGLGLGQKHKQRQQDEDKKKRLAKGKPVNSGSAAPTTSAAGLHPTSKDSLSTPSPKALSRRGSACEMALGSDAREIFLQNRPKTLSSAVISSSIVPAKESLRSARQRSLDSCSSKAATTTTTTKTTTTTTRGRFTIESSAPLPVPTRTRTLSYTSSSMPPSLPLQHTPARSSAARKELPAAISIERPSISLSPSSPHSPHSRSSASRSPTVSMPPSPALSPSPSASFCKRPGVDQDYPVCGTSDRSNTNNSTPISIPRGAGKPSHQRTHSNSSIQSSTSTSSRRSQVIIPPPPYVASLQFASFSSITSSNNGNSVPPSSTGCISAAASQQQRPSSPERSRSFNNNNIRNLSIQIVGSAGDKNDSGQLDSRDNQVFHMEPSVHPLDSTHQTMNRVHPQQLPIESPAEGGQHGRDRMSSSSVGYFRQRSLSATNLGSRPPAPRSMSAHSPVGPFLESQHLQPSQPRQAPQMQHRGSWAERPTRRSHGSVTSSGVQIHGGRLDGERGGSSSSMLSSSYGSSSSSSTSSSHAEASDVVMIKKSATGRMFTVERAIPVSPTKCSRFTLVSSTDELCVPTTATTPLPPRPSSPLQK